MKITSILYIFLLASSFFLLLPRSSESPEASFTTFLLPSFFFSSFSLCFCMYSAMRSGQSRLSWGSHVLSSLDRRVKGTNGKRFSSTSFYLTVFSPVICSAVTSRHNSKLFTVEHCSQSRISRVLTPRSPSTSAETPLCPSPPGGPAPSPPHTPPLPPPRGARQLHRLRLPPPPPPELLL